MKWIGLTAMFLLPLAGMAQDCSQFKTGEFYLKDTDGNKIENYTIVRKKKKQIEHLPNGGVSISKIEWISDCTYTLTNIKTKLFPIPKGTVTTVTITETFEGGFTGFGSSTIQKEVRTFTMYTLD